MTRQSSPLDRIAAKPSSFRNPATLLLGAVASFAVIIGMMLYNRQQPLLTTAASNSGKPFSLLVTLEFQDATARHEFLGIMKPMGDYVRKHEPQTLSYQVLQSDQNPLQLMVLERYTDKNKAYLDIHKQSKAFSQDFRPQLKAMADAGKVKISGHSYNDITNMGFMDHRDRR